MSERAVRYSPAAKRDLSEIAHYLAEEAGKQVAKSVIARIRRKIHALSRDAMRYRERLEFGPGRRAILIGPYLAFYRVVGDAVVIQRILHSAREISLDDFPN